MPLTQPGRVGVGSINGADTAWMMTSTALVLLMTLPGIALFYGGMVRRKSVLNVMACVVAICAIVSLLWFAVGYSIAFTPGSGAMGHLMGGTERLWFSGLDYAKDAQKVAVSHIAPNIPESVYAMFQLTFAIITAGLVVGSFVERMRFSDTLIFTALRTVVVYAAIAHWVLEPNGWLARLGALDFAGGSVVHINAGVAGLVCAYVLGPRKGYGREPFSPTRQGRHAPPPAIFRGQGGQFHGHSARRPPSIRCRSRGRSCGASVHAGARLWQFFHWKTWLNPLLASQSIKFPAARHAGQYPGHRFLRFHSRAGSRTGT